MQDGCPLAPLATVSREWQTDIERHNFARIRLTLSRLANFRAIIQRNRTLVGYIRFCLELDEYDCTTCALSPGRTISDEFEEALAISGTDKCPITASFQDLFSRLKLDISLYSPNDSDYWFPYLTFLPDTPSDILDDHTIEKAIANRYYHDPEDGWLHGSRHLVSPPWSLRKLSHLFMEQGPFDSDEEELEWWNKLSPVPAVTSSLLRQQSRRRWKPESLAHMFARLPRLQEVHYEPWREWDNPTQNSTGRDYHINFNQQYPANERRREFLSGEDVGTHALRKPIRDIGEMITLTSLSLEHLAASHFFETRPDLAWPNLKSLALTAKVLTYSIEIDALILAAATVAEKVPQLETMETWNGRKGLAVLFRYQAFRTKREAVLSRRGTWMLAMDSSERLNEANFKSHGDTIQYLRPLGRVIRPVSLQQIQIEQKASEGVATVE
ncbi:LOW QUALITY PROTEIN: uncharacterized protein BDZ83DRAFT_775376 [Colletotrichum acutatum]|uniref:DUF6546 domain-containing protein n=1 Tax=Glomerella acutata TaxID=27357 RepID=A0AAD8XJB3_GLOAC|nr:LOW QUALITY PROTEIN: uncharacterized protein BDZ83DRAFT_775376 [Colletotrichum acutatum]KAK1726135.1 LOW QUALITY PROTEIN: hypothetical protein BDZ83DRAFT_775376 [Colletotrichum acutatum]